MKIIAKIETDFPEKFGIPRQSNLVKELKGTIVFEKEYRNKDALKGLEGYNYIWLLWQFEGVGRDKWSVTVRPPRLGGNTHMGVFATRSPFRPNPIGLSCVELERIDFDCDDGPLLHVRGADLMDGTPIYDIKPYVKYADSRPHASCGYVDKLQETSLKVDFPSELSACIRDKAVLPALIQVLSLDPRPSYHDDPERVYGLSFAGYNVRFKVSGRVLEVVDVK